MYKVFLLFIVSVISLQTFSQQFGGIPPSLTWKQINTKPARIIFHKGMEQQASKIATIIETLNNSTTTTAGGKIHKINVVLENQTTVSNGYVQIAPFKSEFMMTPFQNSFQLGSLPWWEQLASHEYRHVQQYSNYRVGVSKFLYFLFGEDGQELGNDLSVPNWFWEGDAVYQETMVTQQGRGRLPYYFNGYKSLWLGNKNYSFLKLRNGSYRDFVPDHYPLGYMLVAYGRQKYGEEFWEKVSLDAASMKGLFYPLQKAIKQNAGISYSQFRDDAFQFFKSSLNVTPSSSIKPDKKKQHFIADENFPQWIDSSHIIYVRASYKQPPFFIIRDLNSGKEKIIKPRAISLDNYFSYKNGKAVYAAYEADLRWGWTDFSVLRLLTISTGKEKQITSKTKYFSPDISSDGSRIVAVKIFPTGQSELHILDTNGEVLHVLPNHNHLFFTYPKFYNDSQIVACVRNEKGAMAVGLFNIYNEQTILLTPFSMNPVGFPSVYNDIIYFTATHNGEEKNFAITPTQTEAISLPKKPAGVGFYQLVSNGEKFAWTEFTANGFLINKAKCDSVSATIISNNDLSVPLTSFGIDFSKPENVLQKVDSAGTNYPVKKYASTFKLFHFHSWRPFINDPDYEFSFLSNDILNTLQSEVYVDYNRNEKSTQFGFDATYARLFPWITAGVNYTLNNNALYHNNMVYWNEAQAQAGLSIPINFTQGRHYTNFQIGSNLVYNQSYFLGAYKDSFVNRPFTYLSSSFSFSNQCQAAQQQIYPNWAQSLTVKYNNSISAYNGGQLLLSGYFYFPGLFKINNLVLGAAFQEQNKYSQVFFTNNFPFSRGYTAENFYNMYRMGATYHFPIAYPECGFGSIVYLLRIQGDLFFDYTGISDFNVNGNPYSQVFRSAGTEIYFDTKWWNQLPVSFGIRYSRLLDADFAGRSPNQWEFVLPINLLGK